MYLKSKLKFEKCDLWPHHYFGWRKTINSMLRYETVENPVLFEPAVEATFVADATRRPDRIELYKKHPWVGVFHHPHNDSREWFGIEDIVNREERQADFGQCLSNLKGIFTVSSEQKLNYEKIDKFSNIPISMLFHPAELSGESFSWDKFSNNNNKQILFVGDHLRNHNVICNIKSAYKKAMILGKVDTSKKSDGRFIATRYVDISNERYDELLSKNIVVCEFDTVSASNTIVECVTRTTPILVNRLPSVVEYLGYEYPLYYESVEEAQRKLNDRSLVECAHLYLKHWHGRNRLTLNYFHKSIFNSEVYKSL